MKELIVKYKCISGVNFDGRIDTKDARYKIKVSKNKLVKWLIKNEFRFSVGVNGKMLTDNLNYIEVWSKSFLAENYYEKNELMRKFLDKHSIKKEKK